MPAPPRVMHTPFNVVRLNHADLGVANLARARAFHVDTLGLQVTHEEAGTLHLRRMDGRAHPSLILREGPPEAAAPGFRVLEEEDLDRARAWFVALEFHARMNRLDLFHQRRALYRAVRPLRIDHFNPFSPDVDAATAFYAAMGLRVTEYTIDLMDLMSTSGRLPNIEREPGRHGISNALFLHVRGPGGHRIELHCSDYQTVDPDHDPIRRDPKDPQCQTHWGAPAPRSRFEEGSRFAGADLAESGLKATSIVAP